jgi:hypothetical protein
MSERHRSFRAAVGRAVCDDAGQTGARREPNHPTVARFDHDWQVGGKDVQIAVEMNVKHGIPIVFGRVRESRKSQNTGVYQDIERPEVPDYLFRALGPLLCRSQKQFKPGRFRLQPP